MDKPKCWVKNKIKFKKNAQLKVKVLTQHLGLSIFDPNLDQNNPALFRVYYNISEKKRIKLSLE